MMILLKTYRGIICIIMVSYCLVWSLKSQESHILKGTIHTDSMNLSEINVVNISLKIGTVTRVNGTFKITIRVKDTLHISAIPFVTQEVVITEAIWKKSKLSLYLEPTITELKEVVISNIDLTGNLLKDINGAVFKERIDPQDLGLPLNARPVMTLEERRYYGATAGAGGLGSLINVISGRTKMLKKHLEVSKLKASMNVNRNKFSDSLYMAELKIPEELIEDFVYYVFEDKKVNQNLGQDNIFELLELLQEKAPSYRALKRNEGINIKSNR